MELTTYISGLWRRKWVVIITTTLAVTIAVVGTLLATPMYEARALLRVAASSTNLNDRLGWDELQYTDRLFNTYIRISSSDTMLVELAAQLGRVEAPSVEIEAPANTELLQITVRDPDPQVAVRAATLITDMLEQQVRAEDQRTVIVVASPTASLSPVNRRASLNVAVALALGLVAGVGIAFLFEYLDSTLYSVQQIQQATGLLPFGVIPKARGMPRAKLFDPGSTQNEAFRLLRASLFAMQGEPLPRRILVSSAVPSEGKSTVVGNLAMVIAQSGHKTIVIDCNLRRPMLHTLFDLPNEKGLSNLLQGCGAVEDVLARVRDSSLTIITSGPCPTGPAELLSGPQMRALVDHLVQEYDIVILDTPPLLSVADATGLVPAVHTVVLVASCGVLSHGEARAVGERLTIAGAPTVRLVVNQTGREEYSHY